LRRILSKTWGVAQAELVLESYRDGVSVADVPRKNGISAPQLHSWRRASHKVVLAMPDDDILGLVPVVVEGHDGGARVARWNESVGFLLGALMLSTLGFVWATYLMAGVLFIILVAIAYAMPAGLPTGRKGAKFSEVFSKSANVNWLSVARLFLFGARDVWFVVGIPIYFYSVLSDGTAEGNRTAFFIIGTFMAAWIILYGLIQGLAPKVLRAGARSEAALIADARRWAFLLSAIPAALACAAFMATGPSDWLTALLIVGLLAFGAVFAINSSLHSYLILAFTKSERVTMDVGFYYMANAGGRLIGTVLSGAAYQVGGLVLLLACATVMVLMSMIAAGQLRS
jgi:hypothetical protein